MSSCSYGPDAPLRRCFEWPNSHCLHDNHIRCGSGRFRHTGSGIRDASNGHARGGQAHGTLMDLVYPKTQPTGHPASSQFQSDRQIIADHGGISTSPHPALVPGRPAANTPLVDKSNSSTWLVGEQGEWRKRRAPCMCRHADCPGLTSQQGLAYIAVRLSKLGNRVERYFEFRTKRELHVGKQTVDQKCGLRLSESAHAALNLLGDADLKHHDVVVLRGVASGMGCRHGPIIYAPMFRPVCAMDYIVTKY